MELFAKFDIKLGKTKIIQTWYIDSFKLAQTVLKKQLIYWTYTCINPTAQLLNIYLY